MRTSGGRMRTSGGRMRKSGGRVRALLWGRGLVAEGGHISARGRRPHVGEATCARAEAAGGRGHMRTGRGRGIVLCERCGGCTVLRQHPMEKNEWEAREVALELWFDELKGGEGPGSG
ncbi:hypothetical protein HYPSUDRAFT_203650 [Hypholoma sublateritium FD-334 SS-4]|uniref:Uncharacterized protein n=1 Tax=Hypholoma sublateritium (strain FD-334 SS-4) TaxID=945553 RepID=A0A0D2NW32_HYPSF|nr:hypothetical protein HYPSUDRAFT_203650 [Hypholoma sublateritium FD-334 SS-4]